MKFYEDKFYSSKNLTRLVTFNGVTTKHIFERYTYENAGGLYDVEVFDNKIEYSTNMRKAEKNKYHFAIESHFNIIKRGVENE